MKNNPIKRNVQGSVDEYNYLTFDSVFEFNEFVDERVTMMSNSNTSVWEYYQEIAKEKIAMDSGWYGTAVPENIKELEQHRTFLDMSLLKLIQPLIKTKLARYMDVLKDKVLPKPEIAYNDRGLGVFSFDRAAMGMHKHYPVNSKTALSLSTSQMGIELNRYGVQTSVKNVYTYFKNKSKSYPSLQLFIMSGANAHVSGNDMLYVGLAVAELVEFMEQRGVPVEINILLGTSFGGQSTIAQIRLKRYQDTLDKNQLLLMSSDPRYFRYRGFKSLIVLSDYFNLSIPSSLGRMNLYMGTNFIDEIYSEGFVFEQSYSIDKAVKEVTNVIVDYTKKMKNNGS